MLFLCDHPGSRWVNIFTTTVLNELENEILFVTNKSFFFFFVLLLFLLGFWNCKQSINPQLVLLISWGIEDRSKVWIAFSTCTSLVWLIPTFITVSSSVEIRMQRAVDRLAGCLKPGGMILLRDYGRYDMAQLRFKKGETAWCYLVVFSVGLGVIVVLFLILFDWPNTPS